MYYNALVRYVIIALIITNALLSYGQSFSIVSLESLPTDLTASTQSRVDLNGKRCGLVKVQCVLDGINFSGNIIGDVVHKDGEYWVYLTTGSKQLSISHPRLLPLDVKFSNFTQSGIISGNTYRLILSIPDALYVSILTQSTVAPTYSGNGAIVHESVNNTISGVVTDRKDGEPLIGCTVLLKNANNWAVCDIDGHFTLKNIKPGATLQVSYIGYKQKEITFTGKIPTNYNITLKEGHGTEKEEYFYDPNDKADYFDLKGNKLTQRPSKKGTYIRVVDSKAERFTIK